MAEPKKAKGAANSSAKMDGGSKPASTRAAPAATKSPPTKRASPK